MMKDSFHDLFPVVYTPEQTRSSTKSSVSPIGCSVKTGPSSSIKADGELVDAGDGAGETRTTPVRAKQRPMPGCWIPGDRGRPGAGDVASDGLDPSGGLGTSSISVGGRGGRRRVRSLSLMATESGVPSISGTGSRSSTGHRCRCRTDARSPAPRWRSR